MGFGIAIGMEFAANEAILDLAIDRVFPPQFALPRFVQIEFVHRGHADLRVCLEL